MNLKSYIYSIIVSVLLIFSACSPDKYDLGGKGLTVDDLVEGLAYTITHDSENPNIVYLESKLGHNYTALWEHPQGRSQEHKVTLKIPFEGTYTVTFGVETRGGVIYGEPTTFTVKDFCAEFVTDELWTMLTGGVGESKTWIYDNGSYGFLGGALSYGDPAANANFEWNSFTENWTPGMDHFSDANLLESAMTFDLIGAANYSYYNGTDSITEKGLFRVNTAEHTLSFTNADLMHPSSWAEHKGDWRQDFKIIELDEHHLRLGYKRLSGSWGGEWLEVFNYVSKEYADNYEALKVDTYPILKNVGNDIVQIASNASRTGLLSTSGSYSWQTGDFFVGDDLKNKKGGKGLLLFDLSVIPQGAKIVKVELWLTSELRLDNNFGGQIRLMQLSNFESLNPDQKSWESMNYGTTLGNTSIVEGKTISIAGSACINMVSNNIGKKIGISVIHNTIGKIARFLQKNCWLEVSYEKSGTSGDAGHDIDNSYDMLSVEAKNITKNSSRLEWNIISSDVRGFQIADASENIFWEKEVIVKPPMVSSYYDVTNLVGDSVYTFGVRYFKYVVAPPNSPTVMVRRYSRWSKVKFTTLPSKVPGIPRNIKIEDINNGCILSWNPPVGNTHWPVEYTIYQKNYNSSTKQWETVKTYEVGTSLRYEISSLQRRETYNFFIEAKNSAGKGENVHVVAVIKDPPVAPTNLRITRYGVKRMLNWDYTSLDIDSFKVFAHAPNFVPIVVDKSQKWAYVGDVTYVDVKYFYMVAAYKGRLASSFGSLEYYEPFPKPANPIDFREKLSSDGDRILQWNYSYSDITDFLIILKAPEFFKKQFVVDKDQRELNIGKTFSGLNYTFTIQARKGTSFSDEISLSFEGGSTLNISEE